MELIHGGDVAGYRLRYGRDPVDFSASLNPLGMPPAVRAAAVAAVDGSVPYPDPLCRDLVAALAAELRLPAEWLVCGNGAADLIHRVILARRPKTALLPVPTFAEYEAALEAAGCAIAFHPLHRRGGFRLAEDILEKIAPGLDAVFLCQPGNPTGQLADPALLRALLARTAETGTLCFVDECFLCFVDHPEAHSLVGLAGGHPHLFVLDSFTKRYAMAGIRLGYGVCSDGGLLDAVRRTGQPWAVSTVAQAAGTAALAERDYLRAARAAVRDERAFLRTGLEALGFTVIGSRANYLFFNAPHPRLDLAMMDQGVLIRNCANYRGLAPGWFRVAVRGRADNELLLRALAKAVTQ